MKNCQTAFTNKKFVKNSSFQFCKEATIPTVKGFIRKNIDGFLFTDKVYLDRSGRFI